MRHGMLGPPAPGSGVCLALPASSPRSVNWLRASFLQAHPLASGIRSRLFPEAKSLPWFSVQATGSPIMAEAGWQKGEPWPLGSGPGPRAPKRSRLLFFLISIFHGRGENTMPASEDCGQVPNEPTG